MITITDQMNRAIRLEGIPERIVSLVPSQTELLYDLGLGDRVVGITKFCIHPAAWFAAKKRVGGTKNPDLLAIRSLNPDLIIGNKEENSEKDIARLSADYPVYMSDIFTVNDACAMIRDVGMLTGTQQRACEMVHRITTNFEEFPQVSGSVLYLIWANPFMAVGEHTFIGDMIRRFGLQNSLPGKKTRYQTLSEEDITALDPDYIFLSSEPFPFREKHADALRHTCRAQIHFTDGELFSWYGSRMLRMKNYFTLLSQRLKGSS